MTREEMLTRFIELYVAPVHRDAAVKTLDAIVATLELKAAHAEISAYRRTLEAEAELA